jgi:hypothetical protein
VLLTNVVNQWIDNPLKAEADNPDAARLPVALEDQLGLKLELRREPTDVVRERRDSRYSALVLARSDGRPGPQLERCGDGPIESRPVAIPRNAHPIPFSIRCEPMAAAAEQATLRLNTLVVDETGLTGRWRFAVFSAADVASPDSPPPFPTVLRGARAEVGAAARADRDDRRRVGGASDRELSGGPSAVYSH